MKNIHILKTGKPSRLLKDIVDETYQFKKEVLYGNRFELPLNIYITNDEEIKEGDYGILGKEVLSYHQMHKRWGMPQGKKIILTTDADLVKDGVKAIPDDFLEWFIKNPSCEYVEVKPLLSNNGRALFGYKTVIPKEEVFEMYKNLYGKSVKMNDRFETEHIWSEELALINKDRWIPKEVIETANLEKEMFELEQELDIPSHLRFHNSKTQIEIDEDYSDGLTMGQIIPKEEPKKKHKIIIVGNGLPKQGTMSEAIKQVINEQLQKEPNQSAVEFLVEQLQSQSFIPKDSIVINHFIKVAVELENQQKDKYATDFLDSIREYERENGSRVCFDERDSKELLEIYKIGKDEIK